MRQFGAEVHLARDDFDAAKDAARAHAQRTGARFVEDGAEPAIAEGAGSLAVEWPEPIDAVYVPVGNLLVLAQDLPAVWSSRSSDPPADFRGQREAALSLKIKA